MRRAAGFLNLIVGRFQDIQGAFAFPSQPNVPARFTCSRDSFVDDAAADGAGAESSAGASSGNAGNRGFMVPGRLVNVNTVEDFKKADKRKMLQDAANSIMADVASGAALDDPRKLCRFLLLTFAVRATHSIAQARAQPAADPFRPPPLSAPLPAPLPPQDLKKHTFIYWFAFPALPLEPAAVYLPVPLAAAADAADAASPAGSAAAGGCPMAAFFAPEQLAAVRAALQGGPATRLLQGGHPFFVLQVGV